MTRFFYILSALSLVRCIPISVERDLSIRGWQGCCRACTWHSSWPLPTSFWCWICSLGAGTLQSCSEFWLTTVSPAQWITSSQGCIVYVNMPILCTVQIDSSIVLVKAPNSHYKQVWNSVIVRECIRVCIMFFAFSLPTPLGQWSEHFCININMQINLHHWNLYCFPEYLELMELLRGMIVICWTNFLKLGPVAP